MISFILNLPDTIVGLVVATLSFPKKIILLKSHYAFVADIRSLWWSLWWMKGARAATIGHVVLIGPNVQTGDLEHELTHVRQYQMHPLTFPFLYYTELIRKGYRNNKYEMEAYQEAGNKYEKSEASRRPITHDQK
jgi:hypothetical protein